MIDRLTMVEFKNNKKPSSKLINPSLSIYNNKSQIYIITHPNQYVPRPYILSARHRHPQIKDRLRRRRRPQTNHQLLPAIEQINGRLGFPPLRNRRQVPHHRPRRPLNRVDLPQKGQGRLRNRMGPLLTIRRTHAQVRTPSRLHQLLSLIERGRLPPATLDETQQGEDRGVLLREAQCAQCLLPEKSRALVLRYRYVFGLVV